MYLKREFQDAGSCQTMRDSQCIRVRHTDQGFGRHEMGLWFGLGSCIIDRVSFLGQMVALAFTRSRARVHPFPSAKMKAPALPDISINPAVSSEMDVRHGKIIDEFSWMESLQTAATLNWALDANHETKSTVC